MKTERINGVSVTYVALSSSEYDIYARSSFGKTAYQIALEEEADYATVVSFAEYVVNGIPIGLLRENGKTVMSDTEKTKARDSIYMGKDGRFFIGKPSADSIWSMQGSPVLLRDGKNVVKETASRDQTPSDILNGGKIREATGLINENTLIMLRTHDNCTLNTLADIMLSLKCKHALNGDGGGSTFLYPKDKVNGRKMGAALIAKKRSDKVKPILIIDAGHGGTDPGSSGNGIIEKVYTLLISLYQRERCNELGIPVAMTRTADVSLSNDARTNMVKSSGAKYCISNHLNSHSNTSARGTEVIHSIHNDGKLAKMIVDSIKTTGQVLRPTPTFTKKQSDGRDWYFMQRETGNVSTQIVEYDFLSNRDGADYIVKNHLTLAEAVIKAFCEYTGYKYTPRKVEIPVKENPAIKLHDAFKDVPINHWAIDSINWGEKNGLIVGKTDGTLGLGEAITIERLLTILHRYDKLK